ncbi:MAG TPA: PEP-CTERM sorting domain-containing protein [Bryobacteraceae bacterium]|nr:PEP-CTERM sorting domain-containing protein [Bryobacteraceae bacterium]
MRIYIGILIFTFASLTATADTITLKDLGNDQGWSDGSSYTGYVTIGFGGSQYPGLCIDALHETIGDSWDALYIPLTDSAGVAGVMSAYFEVTDPSVYLPKLYADMAGYAMLSNIGADESLNNAIQHVVWAQFDPGSYTDTGILSAFSTGHPPIDTTQFGLIVDAGYATGGRRLEQAFLVNPHPPALQDFFVDPQSPTPEPASVILVGTTLIAVAALLRKRRARSTQRD